MDITKKVAKLRLMYHSNMLSYNNVMNQLHIINDDKAEKRNKKHIFECFDAMERMGLDPYKHLNKRQES